MIPDFPHESNQSPIRSLPIQAASYFPISITRKGASLGTRSPMSHKNCHTLLQNTMHVVSHGTRRITCPRLSFRLCALCYLLLGVIRLLVDQQNQKNPTGDSDNGSLSSAAGAQSSVVSSQYAVLRDRSPAQLDEKASENMLSHPGITSQTDSLSA